MIIEESKQTFELSKEDIKEHFRYIMKECPNCAIQQLIQRVNVYSNKIEIILNSSNQSNERTIKQVFTETLTTQRQFKGGKTKTGTKTYDIYLII